VKIIKDLDAGTAGVLACSVTYTGREFERAGEDACGPSMTTSEIPGGVR